MLNPRVSFFFKNFRLTLVETQITREINVACDLLKLPFRILFFTDEKKTSGGHLDTASGKARYIGKGGNNKRPNSLIYTRKGKKALWVE